MGIGYAKYGVRVCVCVCVRQVAETVSNPRLALEALNAAREAMATSNEVSLEMRAQMLVDSCSVALRLESQVCPTWNLGENMCRYNGRCCSCVTGRADLN
eukprot:scaffold36258_cov15-Tisochrysis_lutea.AAC.2